MKNKLLTICRSGILKKTDEETLPEPYIPSIPDNCNGGLVLAEAQNHGAKSREYLEWLRGLNSEDRMLRLFKYGEKLGCQPWDDGTLKFALACAFDSDPAQWAVGNAVLWSRVHGSGRNDNPSESMTENSVRLWTEYLKVLKPRLIVTAGKVARTVMNKAGYQGARLSLLLPSPMNLRRMSSLFDTEDLLARYPEVGTAAKAQPALVSSFDRSNKIFFACHAVSMARKLKTPIIGGFDGKAKTK